MSIQNVLKDGQLNERASSAAIQAAIAALGRSLPSDYLQFIGEHDGGEGFIGDNYLILWKSEELATFNRQYEVEKYAPGIVLFGSDGGGEGYGFDTREATMPVVRIPFIGMNLRYAKRVAENINDLLVQLAK
ncbi:SMI1/KNR4 family protein [Comamonas sp. B21-038]|uniref:SMI1/KNR4 family protein n=1 Tax=Comamonas sp. B21-038 TaxID=2918299 RepID=UPI001EFAB108|nr:SMI1/KNR4 family protein [Comamonas sp. B21-038]ULR88298.1 SMI1/KNR4 family protein [Comamonas sp. B21-038]